MAPVNLEEGLRFILLFSLRTSSKDLVITSLEKLDVNSPAASSSKISDSRVWGLADPSISSTILVIATSLRGS